MTHLRETTAREAHDRTNPNDESQNVVVKFTSVSFNRALSFLRPSPAAPERCEGGSFACLAVAKQRRVIRHF